MKRVLTFLAAFIGIALIVFGIVFGLGWDAFDTLNKNRAGLAEGSEWVEKTYSLQALTEYIAANPQHVSVVSYNINNPDSGIFYNADSPRTMGALQNILLLIEYERQVEKGIINPEQSIAISEFNTFVLPKMNERIHKATLSKLSLSKDDEITIDELVSAMIQNNDLVFADWLYFYLDKNSDSPIQIWDTLLEELSLSHISTPEPFIGTYITLQRGEIGAVRDSNTSTSRSNAEKFINNEDFRNSTIAAFKEDYIGLDFQQERDALKYFPQTIPYEFANAMARIQKEELISTAASQRMKEKLSWPKSSPTIQRSFTEYGAIYDNRMGLLSGVDFGTSVFDNHTSVQAVFFDSLQVAFWLHMSANHMQEDYQQRLIWDPALYETTQKAIMGNSPNE